MIYFLENVNVQTNEALLYLKNTLHSLTLLVDIPCNARVHYQLYYNTYMYYDVWKINFDYVLYVTKIMKKKFVIQYIHK